jgi:hypothetical protein
VQQLRPPLLDDLSATGGSEAETCCRAGVIMLHYDLDDPDDEPDVDDDDLDEDDEEEEEDEDGEDEETWQVSGIGRSAKGQPALDFGLRTA